LAWFQEFLKQELAPYPGRAALVARMVIAATVVMIVNMTFRIPFGAYGAAYALTIPRGNRAATLKAVRTIVIAYSVAAVNILIGGILVVNDPVLRFLWVVGNLFVAFFAISALTNFAAGTYFGYLLAISIPLWDQHIPAEQKVDGTLWAFAAITLGTGITLAVELIYAEMSSRDPLLGPIGDRLACVDKLLTAYAEGRPVDADTERQITGFVMQGTSRLRSILLHSDYAANYREKMGAVLAITRRIVDIAANVKGFDFEVRDEERERVRALARSIGSIRTDLLEGKTPERAGLPSPDVPIPNFPLLREMEAAVRLISDALTESRPLGSLARPTAAELPRSTIFVPGAFSNPEHLEFGLRGCFAASLCYIFYTAAAWPEISTSVTTCLLTALTTVGASRQKQILRFSGALVGGALSIGAQVFILPHLDSIAGFTVLFVAVSSAAGWVLASGPRLSYFGAQVAVAFYLVNLLEFKFQTSLLVARDRVLGILFGLFAMWLAFDQLGGAPAIVQMKSGFVKILRSLAQFTREPQSTDQRTAIERSYDLRETINACFDHLRANGDAVMFEFGPSRQRDLALRGQMLDLLPRLRTLFVTRTNLWRYRISLPGFELPATVRLAQQEIDYLVADRLDQLAARMFGSAPAATEESRPAVNRLEVHEPELAKELQAFLRLSNISAELVASLEMQISE
jgi:multidrug resistance protein MdtO